MPTFKITVAYDGTGFVGWQRQSEGTSIQGLLEDALRELDNGRECVVIGAGRTDAGVHALGQVASCSLNRAIDGSRLRQALNARLPPEVRVLSAEEAPETFHARFDARAKVYRYSIWNGEVMSPFDLRYAWHQSGTLDDDPPQRGRQNDRRPQRARQRCDLRAERFRMRRVLEHERALQISRTVETRRQTEVSLEQRAGAAKKVQNGFTGHRFSGRFQRSRGPQFPSTRIIRVASHRPRPRSI